MLLPALDWMFGLFTSVLMLESIPRVQGDPAVLWLRLIRVACFGFDAGDELISPCMCKGTQQFVHRSCLDHWRSVKVAPIYLVLAWHFF